jgi:hypothetical protein
VPVKPQDSELSSICVFRVIDFGSVPTSVEFDCGTVCVSNLGPSIDRVKQMTIKLVFVAFLLSTVH